MEKPLKIFSLQSLFRKLQEKLQEKPRAKPTHVLTGLKLSYIHDVLIFLPAKCPSAFLSK